MLEWLLGAEISDRMVLFLVLNGKIVECCSDLELGSDCFFRAIISDRVSMLRTRELIGLESRD